MSRKRIIPCLLLNNDRLVKTIKFKNPAYIGDPLNAVRIFNDYEVDELIFLDILASKNRSSIQYSLLENIANECFMPLAYGGGISSVQEAEQLFKIGFEKVVLNTQLFHNWELIRELVQVFGSQAIVASIDVKSNIFGKKKVYMHAKSSYFKDSPSELVSKLESLGVGEIFLTSVDREGTWSGYDLDLISQISTLINIPLIANGGAATTDDFINAIDHGASAVAAGSMFVFQKKNMGVLINMPDRPLNI